MIRWRWIKSVNDWIRRRQRHLESFESNWKFLTFLRLIRFTFDQFRLEKRRPSIDNKTWKRRKREKWICQLSSNSSCRPMIVTISKQLNNCHLFKRTEVINCHTLGHKGPGMSTRKIKISDQVFMFFPIFENELCWSLCSLHFKV